MSEIELAFTDRNAEMIRAGAKHATVRRTRHGEVGDTFKLPADGAGRPSIDFEILAVLRMHLTQAATTCFSLEGEIGPRSFLREWALCYGIPPEQVSEEFSGSQDVFVHIFGRTA